MSERCQLESELGGAPERTDALYKAASRNVQNQIIDLRRALVAILNNNVCRDTSADNMNCGYCGNECCTTREPVQTSHPGGPSYGYCE